MIAIPVRHASLLAGILIAPRPSWAFPESYSRVRPTGYGGNSPSSCEGGNHAHLKPITLGKRTLVSRLSCKLYGFFMQILMKCILGGWEAPKVFPAQKDEHLFAAGGGGLRSNAKRGMPRPRLLRCRCHQFAEFFQSFVSLHAHVAPSFQALKWNSVNPLEKCQTSWLANGRSSTVWW